MLSLRDRGRNLHERRYLVYYITFPSDDRLIPFRVLTFGLSYPLVYPLPLHLRTFRKLTLLAFRFFFSI